MHYTLYNWHKNERTDKDSEALKAMQLHCNVNKNQFPHVGSCTSEKSFHLVDVVVEYFYMAKE